MRIYSFQKVGSIKKRIVYDFIDKKAINFGSWLVINKIITFFVYGMFTN
jgi:hypothetical protein